MDLRVRNTKSLTGGVRFLSLVLGMLALLVMACRVGEPASLEERAQGINKSLMCPVCPAENIDQSQVKLARDMRAIVKTKLEEGSSREQIIQFFVDRYGERVRMEPSTSGFNLVAWLTPPLGVVTGGLLLFWVVRAMAKRTVAPAGEGPPDEEELAPYLALIDQELEGIQPAERLTRRGNSPSWLDDIEGPKRDG